MTAMLKQPLKKIEIPLSKFADEVIPYHQKMYEQQKIDALKVVGQKSIQELNREIRDKKRVIKQLKDLTYELDTLRAQVEDADLDKFDIKTLGLRKIIIGLINGHTEVMKSSQALLNSLQPDKEISSNPLQGATQIQLQENINEVKLRDQQYTLERVENINTQVQDIHEIFKNLNDMVSEQGEAVTNIENNVEEAEVNVTSGAKHLAAAHRLKVVSYPLTGALLGGIIGGPLGLIAGIKIGGLAAVGCAVAGYTGGRFIKKANNEQQSNETNQSTESNQDTEVADSDDDKKDI